MGLKTLKKKKCHAVCITKVSDHGAGGTGRNAAPVGPSHKLPRKIFVTEYDRKLSWCADLSYIFDQLNKINIFYEKRKIVLTFHKRNCSVSMKMNFCCRTFNNSFHVYTTEIHGQFSHRFTSACCLWRWRKGDIVVSPLICDFCKMNEVENEIYILLWCLLYEDIRLPFLQKRQQIHPHRFSINSLEKWNFLLRNEQSLTDSIDFKQQLRSAKER